MIKLKETIGEKQEKPPTQNIYNLKDILKQFNQPKNDETMTLQDLQREISQTKTEINQIKEQIK